MSSACEPAHDAAEQLAGRLTGLLIVSLSCILTPTSSINGQPGLGCTSSLASSADADLQMLRGQCVKYNPIIFAFEFKFNLR